MRTFNGVWMSENAITRFKGKVPHVHIDLNRIKYFNRRTHFRYKIAFNQNSFGTWVDNLIVL